MSEIIYEILKVILPAIITGLFTFFITKYTYNKNRPLDKLEIAYNRVYYPIYRIISDEDDMQKIEDTIKLYLLKYYKYVDVSTIRLFTAFQECEKEAKKKSIYQQFKDNVYSKNSYLRRRLGYLEPGFIQLYKYSIPTTKSFFRITIEFCFAYFFLIICGITQDITSAINIYIISFFMFAILFMVIALEILWCIIRFLYFKIRK